MNIKLKNYDITIKDSITYGDKESIETVFLKSAKMNVRGVADIDPMVAIEGKYKVLEVYILEIKKIDTGEIIPYSREWVKELSLEDGDKLVDTINEVYNKKKQ